MDDDATFPRFFDTGIFGDNSTTPNYWDFGLAGYESRLTISADVVGILYSLAVVYSRDNRIYRDGDTHCSVGGGGIDFVSSAEINLPAEVTKGLVGIGHAVNIVALLNRGTLVVVGIHNLGGEFLPVSMILGVAAFVGKLD